MKTKSLVLKTLNLQNFATFTDQTIKFDLGFNSIVGETGSGKSLILDALNLILGQRADKKIIRKGSEFSVVEANFIIYDDSIKEFFFELGLPFEDEVVIKRVIYKSGTSKAFVNFQQCSISTLSELAKRYIDLVGQFENQKLFSEKYQITLLDSFAGIRNKVTSYQEEFNDYKQLQQELSILEDKQKSILQHKDFIDFQVNELQDLDPSVEDEKDLHSKRELISNQESIAHDIDQMNALFEGNDSQSGIIDLSIKLNRIITNNNAISESLKSDALDVLDKLQDLNYSLNKDLTLNEIDFDIDTIVERLDQYKKLQRKFDTNTEGLIIKQNELLNEKVDLDKIDEKINNLKNKIDRTTTTLYTKATEIHTKRLSASSKLSSLLTTKVQNLKMNGASLELKVTKLENLNNFGISSLSFLAQTNPGEGYFKVKDIASGGELSRILLALKQTISTKDSVSIFLFDEIDTGMGGETAFKIGETLKSVSLETQVIAITHLPQIAQFSDLLIKVDKEVIGNRTSSEVIYVTKDNIKEEVFQMTPLI